MTAIQQGFPTITAPLVDPKTGQINQTWLQLLISLWNRTGQGTGDVVTFFSAAGLQGVTTAVTNPSTTPHLVVGLGNITPSSVAAIGDVTGANLSGNNTGDVTLTGQNYLSIAGQVITANPINLAGTNVTDVLQPGNGGTGSQFFQVAGPTALRTYTFPDVDSTIVTLDATQTLSNKTLEDPVIDDTITSPGTLNIVPGSGLSINAPNTVEILSGNHIIIGDSTANDILLQANGDIDLISDTASFNVEVAINFTVEAGSTIVLDAPVTEASGELNVTGSIDTDDEIETARNLETCVVLGQSAVPVSNTATTAEEVLATIPIPANAMGANGQIEVICFFTYTNGGNNKTMRVRLGGLTGTQYRILVTTTTATINFFTGIANRNATNSQVGFTSDSNTGSFGTSVNALVTSAIDTTTAQDLVITGQKASSGDTLTLSGYTVKLYPR